MGQEESGEGSDEDVMVLRQPCDAADLATLETISAVARLREELDAIRANPGGAVVQVECS
jgi:hypothetical protein